MTEHTRTLLEVLNEQQSAGLPTEDLLHMQLPLWKNIAALHSVGRVARLKPIDIVEADDGTLALIDSEGLPPSFNGERLLQIQPHAGSALKIVGEYRVTVDTEHGTAVADLQTEDGLTNEIAKPIYLKNYRCWELEIGHHDEATDIFSAGLIFASLACGLDFDDSEDVEKFSSHRNNLFGLNPSLHPVLATLIGEMTALNRHERATDMLSLIRRMETYRDQPVGLDIDRVLSESKGTPKRRAAVLSHLRDRLFDLTRRNRLVYFRPTQATVNLTVASVPVVLHLESIRAEKLCTWNGAFASDVLSGRQVVLAKWLRFEDQPYLPSALDTIIRDVRRDRADFGFSNLRLVVAFLHWHNLKEAPDERINSPLLWLPIELVKTKGVRDQYTIQRTNSEAEFNPALRHYLRQLYEIHLPETVDLSETSISDIHRDLEAQIHKTEPGVSLTLQDKPVIQLIHQKAVQRLRQFQRRRGIKKSDAEISRPDFNYDSDDYRPLGFALFEKYVRPSTLPQRLAVGAAMPPRVKFIVSEANASERLTYAHSNNDGHRYKWEIDLTQVTAANFNYKKMSLVRDYNQLIDTVIEQPSFDHVFSIEPRSFESDVPPILPYSEQWGVVAADNTQNAAIALARTGLSLIIQGPPGTGKSQTITNLIADFAARGKRILFVCEKRAALDVVFHRLQQAGLDRLACLVHDSQEDKKEFVLDLKGCYDVWGAEDPNLDHQRAMRQKTVDALDRHVGEIESFEQAMNAVPKDSASSLRTLVRRLISLPEHKLNLGPKERERLPSPKAWDEHRELANRVAYFMTQRFGKPSLAGHPFAMLSMDTVNSDHCYAEVEQFIADGQRQLDQLDKYFDSPGAVLTGLSRWSEATSAARAAKSAVMCGLAKNIAALNPNSPTFREFGRLYKKVADADKAYEAATQRAKNWHNPLPPDDAVTALEQARHLEGGFFKFLNSSWRHLKATVRQRYNFGAHAVTPTITSVLELLVAAQSADLARSAERSSIANNLGVPDLDEFAAACNDINAQIQNNSELRRLMETAQASSDPAEYLGHAADTLPQFEELDSLLAKHLDFAVTMSIEDIAAVLRDMLEGLDDLPDCLPLLRIVAAATPSVAEALRRHPCSPDTLEAAIIEETVIRAMRLAPSLQEFDEAKLSASARRAAKAESLLRGENATVIRATRHSAFRTNVKRSTLSVTQLDSDGKRFKKRYSTGRRELEHEFGKSMRYRSIRELSSGDTGSVINDLKPIWLMSPLSVSDTLPMEPDLFDVVIFDEASQIPTEEAVPAMCRARQVIVVGDEMQLPPTSFFSAARDEDDMQVLADEEGEQIAIMLDADSLLNQAGRSLPATMLTWHYRSRSEALISFSNAAFYEGRLVTIPDQRIPETIQPIGSVQSENEQSIDEGVSRLLDRPITFHHLSDGVYEKRANAQEARYIAAQLRNLLLRETGMSIGIVAFSEAQQTEIENAIEALAALDPVFAERVERESVREDDNQFNGLFIKNLENVQGDERDIIILSICYAPGPDRKMAMNFGPINQRGGEKRLNVIFSRAKHHMAIVSTIHAEAITNTHNDGARALQTFLSYAEAQDSGSFDHAQAILSTINPNADQVFSRKDPDDALCRELAEELKLRGHDVHLDVGSAVFRCDLAIVDPDGGGYALAILLDGGYRDTRAKIADRFVFRPKILKSFGWQVVDIPSTDWLRSRDKVIEAIEDVLDGATGDDFDDDPFDLSPIQVAVLPSTVAGTLDTGKGIGNDIDDVKFEEYHFKQGTSSKFWKIAVNGPEMTVVFGRIGTKGTQVTKVFESQERAKREAAKLVLEKTRKGYSDAG